jgi:hypothetical protein
LGSEIKAGLKGAAIRIEIEKCEKCGSKAEGGAAKIIASIEDPEVIVMILQHLGLDESSQVKNRSLPPDLFDQCGLCG